MRDKYNVRKIADSYKFDESYEINIYNYLCFKKMNKKIKENLYGMYQINRTFIMTIKK